MQHILMHMHMQHILMHMQHILMQLILQMCFKFSCRILALSDML